MGGAGEGGLLEQRVSTLPSSQEVDISCLSRVFSDRTNSYKFLWLKGILSLLKESGYSACTFSFSEIVKEMLVYAWYPRQYYNLSFGYWDKVGRCLEEASINIDGKISKTRVRKAVNEKFNDSIEYQLTRYVPYRFLSPWFKNELKGKKGDAKRHKLTVELAESLFETRAPLYKVESKSIKLHPKWLEYLSDNATIIAGWMDWHWSNYLQDKNPTVPSVANKIDIPGKRSGLSKYREYWDGFIHDADLHCIYTGESLKGKKYSFDHYIPWTYVAHDEPWNIVPVTVEPNVNSMKNNSLPKSKYLKEFLDQQHGMFKYNSVIRNQDKGWNTHVAPDRNLLQVKRRRIEG